jgi:hypothetical protein
LPLEEEGKNNKTRTEQSNMIQEQICTKKEKLKSTGCCDFAVCAGYRRQGRREEAALDLPCYPEAFQHCSRGFFVIFRC